MSENTPTPPPDAVPPKAPEAAKVQPKKETVRITLPPKPTAAPSIKIPSAPQPPQPPTPPAAPAAAAPASAPAAAAPAAAPAAPKPAAPAPTAPRASAPKASSAPAVSGLDKGLAIVAVIVGLAVVGFLMTL